MKQRLRPVHALTIVALILALTGSFSVDSFAQAPTEQEPPAQEASSLKSENEKLSYALGMLFGKQLRAQALEPDLDLVVRGLKDAHSGSTTLLTEEAVRRVVNNLQSELKKNQIALRGKKLADIKEKGEAFLAANKAREGVVTLESGLQYTILKAGDGAKPTIDDTVISHYRGTLIDGSEFASSYKSNQPATFAVKKVIKGWAEALQLMPVGSKWQLFIPSKLAYGERGAGRDIGPNATLIFDVELISIKARNAQAHSLSPEGPADKVVSVDPALAAVKLFFKLDPRTTTGMYLGERWVSPPKYMSSQEGKSITVEARAHGLDAKGRTTKILPTWIPADPEMVTVSPSEGPAVTITVHRAGESRLRVTAQGVSEELPIKAAYQGNVIQVEITQQK